MKKPVDSREMSSVQGKRSIDQSELPPEGVVSLLMAETQTIEDGSLIKVGKYRHFEVFSDELPRSGGTSFPMTGKLFLDSSTGSDASTPALSFHNLQNRIA